MLPTDSTHLSDLDRQLMIEEFGGLVDVQFKTASFIRNFVDVRPVLGTDTIVDNRMGRTTLQALVPGVRPNATSTPFGRVALTVDTTILARDNRSMLNEFQTHFEAKQRLAVDHGKELGAFFDEAFIIQCIKGSGQAAPDLGGEAHQNSIGAGKTVTLDAANDELDPDKLYRAIANIIVKMEEEEIPVEELVVFVRPQEFDTLMENDKLIRSEYSAGNGDYAKGLVWSIKGARIYKTTRIPTKAITGHKLSNAGNSNAYDVSAAEAKCAAVIMHPQSLLAGETIPLMSDIWFNKEEKQWFIDSFMAFGVTVRRPDVCGTVRKA